MSFIDNLPIGRRLGLAFTVLTLLALGLTSLLLWRLSVVTDNLTLVKEDRLPKAEAVVGVTERVNLIAREMRNALLYEDSAKRQEALAVVDRAQGEISEALVQLDKSITSSGGRERLAAVVEQRTRYRAVQDAVIALVRAGATEQARDKLFSDLRPAQIAYIDKLKALKEFQLDLIEASVVDGQEDFTHSRQLAIGMGLAMAVLAALLGWRITRSVTEPMHTAVALARRVADGDLTAAVPVQRRDEAGQLLRTLGDMTASLTRLVASVRSASESIASGSGQIAAGNTDLSQRTEEQASNLQQTAASMEQLHATVNTNADTARQAAQMARGASEVVERGGQAVAEVVTTMNEISASSRKIAEITGIIDGIAFQTNILALNAAVEAARAGEQGRGFAVVAGEVRTLAQRSADAAREIKTLIANSSEQVAAGGELVQRTGVTMQDLVTQVQGVSHLIAEIANATGEQTRGIGQVNHAVTQLDQVTQQNAALVEESAAATESLKLQAERLVATVAQFKLAPA